MKAAIQFNLGGTDYRFEFDERDEMETFHKSIVIGNPPRFCDVCQNNQYFKLTSNKDKEGNIYVNVKCTKCGARSKLGQYKAGGYFWHQFEKYVASKQSDDETKK